MSRGWSKGKKLAPSNSLMHMLSQIERGYSAATTAYM
jgi:hypothetical protein